MLFRSPIKLVVQLIDLKVGATKDDNLMLDWLNQTGTPYIIAATKCDKLNKTNRAANLEKLKENLLIPRNMEIYVFSALTGEGRDDIRRRIFSE